MQALAEDPAMYPGDVMRRLTRIALMRTEKDESDECADKNETGPPLVKPQSVGGDEEYTGAPLLGTESDADAALEPSR